DRGRVVQRDHVDVTAANPRVAHPYPYPVFAGQFGDSHVPHPQARQRTPESRGVPTPHQLGDEVSWDAVLELDGFQRTAVASAVHAAGPAGPLASADIRSTLSLHFTMPAEFV